MNQKSLDKKKPSELFEGVGSSLHQAFVGAVERDKKKPIFDIIDDIREEKKKMLDKNKTKELDWTDIVKNIFFANGVKCDSEQFLIEDILALLTQQRTELLEEIPKKIKGKNKEFVEGYNNAIDDITNLLNKKDE